MTQIAVFTLGKLHLRAGGQTISSFPTRQVEELLAYLLLYSDVAHSREKLIELLWPHEGGTMRGRFSTVLWRLRVVLGQCGTQCLTVNRDTVALTRSSLMIDFVQFEQALSQANRSQSAEEAEAYLRCALELYLGDLYEGLYADWCLLERERLSRLYLRAAGQLMAHLIQRRAYEEAIVLGQRILFRDSLREEVHRAVMYCYGQLRDWSAAAMQFQQCTQLLQDELHIPPMPETVAVYQQIIADRVHHLPITTPNQAQGQAEIFAALAEFNSAAAKLNQLLSQNK
jgi:DNA-binding SARP family transcriptional activator